MTKIIVSGAYGVGKSEFCVQWALQNTPCTIADFDILNPFFRPREIKSWLKTQAVEVIASHLDEGLNQDVPAMSFAFQKALLKHENIIIDCAGSVNGLHPLKSLGDEFKDAEFYVVINLNRSESDVSHIEHLVHEYEAWSQRKVTGFIHNTHLLDETDEKMIAEAQIKLEEIAKKLNIPIIYTLVCKDFYQMLIDKCSNPILKIDQLRLREKWMKGSTL